MQVPWINGYPRQQAGASQNWGVHVAGTCIAASQTKPQGGALFEKLVDIMG